MAELVSPFLIRIPKSAIVFSLLLHLGLVGLLSLFSSKSITEWLSEFIGLERHSIEVQSFVQVDVVGLPDQLVREKINPLLPEISNSETKPIKPNTESKVSDPEIMTEKNSKKPDLEKEKLDRKKQQERALKEAREEAQREQALKDLQNSTGTKGRGKLKGNMLSQGTSSTGVVGTAKDKYVGILTESIKQQFNVFSWQQKKGLVAEVKLMLLANGRVKWRKIVKPSRDVLYDSAVLQAIDDAQPFPIPEDRSLIQDEITINFKP